MITVEGLYKDYSSKKDHFSAALKGISCQIEPGSIFTMLGPSGCGKTTTLRSIAGLEKPTKGEIKFDDWVVFSTDKNIFVPAERRRLGMVFQSYAIWPHMTVGQNVSYPLESKKMSKSEINRKVDESLDRVGLLSFKDRLAPNLSGGQQQRVALARALVSEPQILLLDEPLSNLDAKLREQMRHELKDLQKQLGLTTIYVTHDQEEALALSDQIVLMREGEIVEQGNPFMLYEHPKHRFTASFIGHSNFLKSKKIGSSNNPELTVVENPFGRFEAIDYASRSAEFCDFSYRPHNVSIERDGAQGELNVGTGTLINMLFLGEKMELYVSVDEITIRLRCEVAFLPNMGAKIHFKLNPEKSFVYDLEPVSAK